MSNTFWFVLALIVFLPAAFPGWFLLWLIVAQWLEGRRRRATGSELTDD